MKLDEFDAFILDLDGTLIDSGKYHAQAFADAVREQGGYELTPAEHDEFFATHSTLFAETLNQRYGLELDPQQVLARKRERMHEIFQVELFDGAKAFLERWYGKKPMALSTNSPFSFVLPALEKLGIVHYFNSVATADHVTRRKPDPELVEFSLQRLEVAPARALVFEDQLIGIEAARAAGTAVLAVDNGQPVKFPADVPVRTWRNLLEQ
jgi:HAD superfamily hydrolase (TIGR01509 family)